MLTDADFGYPAWQGYIRFAYGLPEMRTAFTAETGLAWPAAPRNGLEAMIDKATGYEDGVLKEFVLWISEQWGAEECPPSIQAALAAREKGR